MSDRQLLTDFILRIRPMKVQEAEEIVLHFRDKTFEKGDFFLREGQNSLDYLFLTTGLMRSFANNPDGNEITTGFYGGSQMVFEVSSFFNRTLSKENIHAITKCSGLSISYNQLNFLFHDSPHFREFGRAVLVKGFSELKARMLVTITETAEERYLQLLKHHPEVLQHAPLKMIASYLGITDTSLSRIRKEISLKD